MTWDHFISARNSIGNRKLTHRQQCGQRHPTVTKNNWPMGTPCADHLLAPVPESCQVMSPYFSFGLVAQPQNMLQSISRHCWHTPGLYLTGGCSRQSESSAGQLPANLDSKHKYNPNQPRCRYTHGASPYFWGGIRSRWTFKLLTKIRSNLNTATLPQGPCRFWCKHPSESYVQYSV